MSEQHLAPVMVDAFMDAVDSGIDLVPVVSDSTSTAKIQPFMERFPQRVVNVGIAEQSLVGMAAGLALGGKVAATCNAAPFLISRANEQVKVDICYNNANVKLFGLNSGASYGPLASTHHCIDDISVLRGFGRIEIYAPSDAVECRQITDYALRHEGPVYIRMDGKALPVFHDEDYQFVPGQVNVMREGTDVCIVSLGSVLNEAMQAADLLSERGISAQVINLSSIRPLDRQTLAILLSSTPFAVTVEEHNINGGIGDIVAEVIAEQGLGVKLHRCGIPDGEYALAGDRAAQRAAQHFNAEGIVTAVTEMR